MNQWIENSFSSENIQTSRQAYKYCEIKTSLLKKDYSKSTELKIIREVTEYKVCFVIYF